MSRSTQDLLSQLENLLQSNFTPWPAALLMTAIIAVHINLKPVAFEHLRRDQGQKLDFNLLKHSLQQLNIILEITNDSNCPFITWYFSKQSKLIAELQTAFSIWYNAQDDDEDVANRKIGQLLGYPQTAIDYFITRSHAPNSNQTTSPNLNFYIHSPSSAQAEFNQYEKPLYVALQKYCPSTFETLSAKLTSTTPPQ